MLTVAAEGKPGASIVNETASKSAVTVVVTTSDVV